MGQAGPWIPHEAQQAQRKADRKEKEVVLLEVPDYVKVD